MRNILLGLMFGGLTFILSASAPVTEMLTFFTGGTESDPEIKLVSAHWRLVTYTRLGREISVDEKVGIILNFKEGGMVSGSGGCNSYNAYYEISDEILSFSWIRATEIDCTWKTVMEQEKQYLDALENVNGYELEENVLRIIIYEGRDILEFERLEVPPLSYLRSG